MAKCVALLSAFVLCASTSFSHSLTVPFFRDDAPNGSESRGFISIKNTTNNQVTMHVVYIQEDLNGEFVIQEAVNFPLLRQQGVSWRPVGDTTNEGLGQNVPNVLEGWGPAGSAQVIWLDSEGGANALIGRYKENTDNTSFAHPLLGE